MRIVMKFGGTSVADIARLEQVALKVRRQVEQGDDVIVVVSAMAGVTNQLVGYAKSLGGYESLPEYDAVVATGEQITTGLLALALQQLGLKSRSCMGWQVPIRTNDQYGTATIQEIDPTVFEACWAQKIVPVVAGFQGITDDDRITTLGRGGSDTTAVALAAAVDADRCDIYTDVDGVYTADPRVVSRARKLDEISYDEMLELAAQGAKVLHPRSVATALISGTPVQVLSSFSDQLGTMVIPQEAIAQTGISGVTHSMGWLKISFTVLDKDCQELRTTREFLKEADIQHEAMVTSLPSCHVIEMLIPKGQLTQTMTILDEQGIKANKLEVEPDLAKVSVVGRGILAEGGYSQQLPEMLKKMDVPSFLVKITASRMSIAVPESQAIHLVHYLHTYFNLDRIDDNSKQTVAARL
ncbi:MAG: aspartate kinase [Candidatus Paracaedibacteraceae bacterium]|nr:aspartate kinase [Candidatus Paracaedibacteraceae bacterium]